MGPDQHTAEAFRALFESGALGGLGDGQLLDRFLSGGGPAESAFAALVERHGPMVLGVCRRGAGNPDDADDAFQATFLVLARKAGSIRARDSLACWLHGVARRVSADARAATARRRSHERRFGAMSRRPGDVAPFDLGPALHEEVDRLPERYRAAVVLCHLEGLTHDEAAARLRCPVGTVRSRLSRGRDRLRDRLERRGLAPAAWLAGGTPGVVLEGPLGPTIEAAMRIAAGEAVAAGVVPASVASLMKGVLGQMTFHKAMRTAPLAALGLVAVGALAFAAQGPRDDPPKAIDRAAPLPSRSEVRDVLKTWWEGMKTLKFREVSDGLGLDLRPAAERYHLVVDYAHAPAHRRFIRIGTIQADNTESFSEERRYDGVNQMDFHISKTVPPGMSYVMVSDQTDSRDYFEGGVNWQGAVTGLMMAAEAPGNRPLYEFIDRGNELTISSGADGSPRVVLTLRRFGRDFLYDLDPEHGYLPRHIDGAYEVAVTKFARVDGIWFPAEGTTQGPGRTKRRFEVVGLDVNRPIPDSQFTMPPHLVGLALQVSDPPGRFSPETLGKAGAHPGDPGSVAALVAIVEAIGVNPGATQQAFALLLKDHVDDPAITRVVRLADDRLSANGNTAAVTYLRAVVERTGRREVKGTATLELARALERRAMLGLINFRMTVGVMGKNPDRQLPVRGPVIKPDEAASMDREALDLYRRVISDDADVGTLADEARFKLKARAESGAATPSGMP